MSLPNPSPDPLANDGHSDEECVADGDFVELNSVGDQTAVVEGLDSGLTNVSESQRLDETHFSNLGLPDFETRLSVIRVAAKRSAGALAVSQIRDPNPANETRLVQVVLSTYRVIDPRYRDNRFQQIQVGRILPNTLRRADTATLNNTEPKHGDSETPDKRKPARNRLLDYRPRPHVKAGDVAAGNATIQPASKTVDRKVAREQSAESMDAVVSSRLPEGIPTNPAVTLPPPRESDEVLAELRTVGAWSRFSAMLRQPRGVAALITLASIMSVWLFAWSLRQFSPSHATASTEVSVPNEMEPSETKLANDRSATSELENAVAETPVDELPIEPERSVENVERELKESPSDSMATGAAFKELDNDQIAEPAEIDAPLTPESTSLAGQPSELTPLESIELAMAEKGTNQAPDEAPSSTLDTRPNGQSMANVDGAMANVERAMTSVEKDVDKSLEPQPRFEREQLDKAVDELWDETEDANLRFTCSQVSELLDHWDLVGELAGRDSLENAAASQLCMQAAWLIEPIEDIAKRCHIQLPVNHSIQTNGSDLAINERAAALVASWQQARAKVSNAEELNQMLSQANELLDHLILNQQDQWLTAMSLDAQRLTQFATDEVAKAELDQLLEAVETFPEANEIKALREASTPSGLLGRVLCLQLRKWDEGIPHLVKASDPVLSSVAKAEVKLREETDQRSDEETAEQNALLGARWAKVASRVSQREAASIRLHALDLIRDHPDHSELKSELHESLPSYVTSKREQNARPPSKEHGGNTARVRLSRLG